MKRSKLFRLGARDFFKGLVVAILTAIIAFLYEAIAAHFTIDLQMLKTVGLVTLAATLSYLLKNLTTNNAGELLTPDKP